MQDSFDVVVVGAGAAGIAALQRLRRAGVAAAALEARPRIGGRAHTILATPELPLDLGCGWMHSADVNPLVPRVERAGFTVDRSPPHWMRLAANRDFPAEEQAAFRRAREAFEAKLEAAAKGGVDRPASELLEPGGRWNHLLDAVSSYYNGAEYDQVSVLDYAAYEDTGVNYRVREGYGTAVASFADAGDIVTDCPVTTIRHDGPTLRLETANGTLTARAVIVAVPTPILSQARLTFSPGLPEKLAAAAGLPLGLADKAFLSLAEPAMFEAEGHLFGRIDRTETGSYHLRPFGRPYIEVYLGGRCARGLEGEGLGAMTAFAIEELVALIGSDIRSKLAPVAETHWASDPWALGSYSHALPGHAGDRAILAAPVENRLFFAGEATHPNFYSTCHGAWMSGLRAADEALAALGVSPAASSIG
ncbi:MAG: FAD-dependent oxidoreductase [Phenylobacterium sp.]|nr:MAG: FAD-dependent oxidoreductase [Phenylobacterium sp.]